MILRLFALLARPSRQGAATIALPATAFACVTALLAIVLGGAQSFWGYRDELAGLYQGFTVVALVLLMVPLVPLGAAAARLSARRRDDRLAAMRLLGASGSTTTALAILESVSVALAGAAAGIVAAYAASPLVGMIRFRGEPLGVDGVALPLWASAAIIAGVGLIATVSAAVSLRRVIISPLGVALKQRPARNPWLPALIAALGIVLAATAMGQLQAFGGAAMIIAAIGVALAVTLFAIDVIGAWFVGVLARGRVRRAQTPEQLLAARAVLESPRTAWRQVSGVAMSSFMAVFAGAGVSILEVAASSQRASGPDAYLVSDIRTGLIITVVGTFIMVACSVGVGQAAQILDRRDIVRSLEVIGAPLEVQDRARRAATMLPLLLASLGSAAIAAMLLMPLVGGALVFAPLSMITIVGTVGLGIVIVAGALRATRPLLRSAARQPTA